ncbi:SufD family Fe-S cluster assembly protein [Escherichia coli]
MLIVLIVGRIPSRMLSVVTIVRNWEHEATTSRIGEDQLFYCLQRGISEEDAISMIVNGFCKDVFSELPLEFAVEAQKLLAISLEHSVG